MRPVGRVGGVMAGTAGVLALLGVALNVVGVGVLLKDAVLDSRDLDNSLVIFGAIGAALMAFALCFGAILLFRRDETGRLTLIVASGIPVVFGLVGVICSLAGYDTAYGIHWVAEEGRVREIVNSTFGLQGTLNAYLHGDWLTNLTGMIIPLATMLTASSRFTARWVATPAQPRRYEYSS